ncbi:AGL079Cp [Eremothecium gossypii ATCC 10895]|uniref:AGL079Cp n=1 Tax=Eremothecium gossypii (strain ATCC 10895 / CBS 109.51 / FGSC 9923 / NRRL Y-1056) TaxID=284811 RepID=Q751A3_EREGS|nr:AGL079Cp [Eremothecium gossypii ATCC 10895]AAS54411.1 AGL079Cp [Eremothecium gossypii ATCC 10895]AEY98739.1 FAGL079Cp [Eremothecium gossypii FDAG1]
MNYSIVIEVQGRDSVREAHRSFTLEAQQVLEDQQDDAEPPEETLSIVNMRLKDDKIVSRWMGHGTIRLFKCKEPGATAPFESEEDLLRVPGDNTMCSILFVPGYLNCGELLHWFLGPTVLKQVSHFRLVRLHDRQGEYMVLIKFRKPQDAKRFQSEYNGKRFNSLDGTTCHVVYVKEIIFKDTLFPDPNKDFPYLLRDPFTNGSGMVELPTCPVCLERMDSDTTGLITTACQHTFHCQCLDKWKDGRCPVCRYSNARECEDGANQSHCDVCGSSENLWVCLICGHMGCGRYNSKHAIQHYESSSHCFAMDIATKRVWDYAGDNYVHRLVQNEVDGKLVEIGGITSKRTQEYHLEYVQVLISQLESQREYYEAKLEAATPEPLPDLTEKFEQLRLEAGQRSKKQEQAIADLSHQLQEERLMNTGLRENLEHLSSELDSLRNRHTSLIAENEELQGTVKDLMFHLQSGQMLRDVPDATEGSLVVQTEKEPTPKKKHNKKKPPHRFGKS